MKLIFNRRSSFEKRNEITPSGFGLKRSGCWAYVTAVHSDSLTVDAENSNGFKFHYVPVASREWVSKDGGSGERDLPPVGSRVFILMPTGTVQGGFVLCSGFSFNSVSEQADFKASSDKDIEAFNTSRKKISSSGWTFGENLGSGNITAESKGRSIRIEALNEDEKDTGKGFRIEAFGSVLALDENGAVLESRDGGKITISSGRIVAEDSNGNRIETTKTSVKINGNLEVLQ